MGSLAGRFRGQLFVSKCIIQQFTQPRKITLNPNGFKDVIMRQVPCQNRAKRHTALCSQSDAVKDRQLSGNRKRGIKLRRIGE